MSDVSDMMSGGIRDYGANPYIDPELDRILFEQFMEAGDEPRIESINLDDDGGDASKYGASDFYDEAEAKLIGLLSSGKPFSVCGSCRKEAISYEIEKTDKHIICKVFQSMDENEDLLDDAIWDVFGRNIELSPEETENLLDLMFESGVYSEAEDSVTLPPEYDSLDDIKKALDAAQDSTNELLEEQYSTVKYLVKEFIENKGESDE